MKTFVLVPGVLLTFLCLAAGSSDSSCPESCDVSKCEQTSVTCTGGKHVKDDCSCCDVCLRFDNEICGGLHGRFGKCSEGLKCIDVNNEAFMNDDTETEMEDDVVGVCQALTSTETTKIFYISFRLNNTYGKNIVLLTSLTSPHARINISNMETFTLLTGVPNKEPISLQAFVKTSEEKIPINGQDVFFIVPGERQQEPTVLNIPRKLGEK